MDFFNDIFDSGKRWYVAYRQIGSIYHLHTRSYKVHSGVMLATAFCQTRNWIDNRYGCHVLDAQDV